MEISISEGSCDAEEWRNDAENSVFHHHRNKLHFKIYKNCFEIKTQNLKNKSNSHLSFFK